MYIQHRKVTQSEREKILNMGSIQKFPEISMINSSFMQNNGEKTSFFSFPCVCVCVCVFVCVCVCVFAAYRNPQFWSQPYQIWCEASLMYWSGHEQVENALTLYRWVPVPFVSHYPQILEHYECLLFIEIHSFGPSLTKFGVKHH